jgi:cell wall assembly regulator SMI1
MKDLLIRLDHWLRANRPEYHRQLLAGRTEAELAAFEDSLGFGLPQSFKDLYLWRDGQAPDCRDAFQYNRDFQRLEDAAESREILNGCREGGDFEREDWWNPRWVPFLRHWGGDLLCVDMDGNFGGRPGQVLYFYHDSADRTIEFPSLESWLDCFVSSLEAGMWEENNYGFQPKDDDELEALVRRRNPGYPIHAEAG